MAPLTGLVVKSLITSAARRRGPPPGSVAVAGFAWAGEADIARVDISVDTARPGSRRALVGEQQRYSWRRFEFAFAAKRAGVLP